jgi:excisionase family DNA binding protein
VNLEPGPDEPPKVSDRWLTVAEIAAELRVNPATVRLWISKGTLPATRAGQRKLLIRRSDLDLLLRATNRGSSAPGPGTRPRDPRHPGWPPPPQSIRELSTADLHGYRVDPEELQEVIAELQSAEETWKSAQDASENAPPDPGFARRVRTLADACDQQAASLGRAARLEGLAWTPLPDRRHMSLSHELRPGALRPGPPELWEGFDRAVQRLGIAMEGMVMHVVAFQYRELAEVMHTIADELLDETPDTRGGRR